MGIMVFSLLWVMQDLYHQLYGGGTVEVQDTRYIVRLTLNRKAWQLPGDSSKSYSDLGTGWAELQILVNIW